MRDRTVELELDVPFPVSPSPVFELVVPERKSLRTK
jgi:hypothetical protein